MRVIQRSTALMASSTPATSANAMTAGGPSPSAGQGVLDEVVQVVLGVTVVSDQDHHRLNGLILQPGCFFSFVHVARCYTLRGGSVIHAGGGSPPVCTNSALVP